MDSPIEVSSICPNCRNTVLLNKAQETTTCACNTKICSFCGKSDHFGYTCFYYKSTQRYEEVVLTPPANLQQPRTMLESEYIRVRDAFNNFINPSNRLVFSQAKIIINKDLEERYATKKIEMAAECGGRNQINEVYFWHGSAEANYPNILRQGLKVGGVDGIPVVNGTACGYGIYSSTAPTTPIGYTKGSKWLAFFVGMKGKNSAVSITNPGQLKNPNTHSYSCNGDWVIFFTKEQVLPKFLVEYRAA
jgi:Poly(ADP-ribose) polymerase catalytic domain